MNDVIYGLEESIIKACTTSSKLASTIATKIKVDNFSNTMCKNLFLHIVESFQNPNVVDEISLIESISCPKEKQLLRDIILENKSSMDNINEYCDRLLERYGKRKLLETLESTKNKILNDEDTIDIITSLSDNVMKITSANSDYVVDDISSIYDDISQSFGKPLDNVVGIGIDEITDKFGKIFTGSLVGIMARPSMGKTAVVIHQLANLSILPECPQASLVFSLETDRIRFTHRLISNLTDIPCQVIKEGRFSKDELKKLEYAKEKFQNAKLKFADIYDTSIAQIQAVSRREKLKNPELKYIFIDYMQLIDSGTGYSGNRNAELTYISRKLKTLAKELNVIIVELLQLNRGVENRENKRPALSDIRDCITGDSNIYMSDGSIKTIKELYDSGDFIKKSVLGLNELNKISSGNIKDIWKTDKKNVISVTLSSGKTFKCSQEHRFYINGEWINIGAAKDGDLIATPRVIPEPLNFIEYDKREMRMLGYLLADGCVIKSSPKFTTSSLKNKEEIINIAKDYFGCKVNEYDRKTYTELQFSSNSNRWNNKGILKWCKDIGIQGMRSHTKKIPDRYMNSSNENIKELIHSMWSCDGHTAISNNNMNCYYSTTSEELKDQLVLLLNRFGIIARRGVQKKEGYRDCFTVHISGVNQLKLFFSFIGIPNNSLVSGEEIKNYFENRVGNTNVDIVPMVFKTIVKESILNSKKSLGDIAKSVGYHHSGCMFSKQSNWSNDRFNKIASFLNDEKILLLANSEIFWDKIVKIEHLEEKEEMYDMSVEDIETFVDSGVVAHNCGSLEQDLDLCIALYRDDYYDQYSKDAGITEFIVLKNKDGGLGTVKLEHDLPHNKYFSYGDDFTV